MSKFLDELCIDVNDYFNVDILKKTRKTDVSFARACFIVLALKKEHTNDISLFLGLSRITVSHWKYNYRYKLNDEHYIFLDNYKVNKANPVLIKHKSIKHKINNLLTYKNSAQLEKIKQFIIDLDKKKP